MARAAHRAGGDPAFVLVDGRPSLNLVATLGRRHPTRVERIPHAAALGRWLVAAGQLPTAPPVSEAHLGQARQLRAAISSLAGAVVSASPVSGESLADAFSATLKRFQRDGDPSIIWEGHKAGPSAATARSRNGPPGAHDPQLRCFSIAGS
jgi:hypothetical protein